jgi:hypothetical protein
MNKKRYTVHNINGDKMNENLELLMHIYQTAEMGLYATKNLLDLLKKKDNKITHVLEEELKEYEKYTQISETMLKKHDVDPKSSGLMAKMSSDIGMTIETMKDNSDPAIAAMLIEGLTMGTVEMNIKIDKYKRTNKKDILEIAHNLLEFQENEIEKLKTFL